MFWIKQILIALDQLLNACLHGWADETLSSRAHRRRTRGKSGLANFIDVLLWFDKDHCRESYESERIGRQLPPELRPPIAPKQ